MHHVELPPPRDLAHVVECVWMLSGEAPTDGAPAERILPDGCPELVASAGAPFERRDGEHGPPERQERLLFAGQLERWLTVRPTGPVDMVGVRLQPHGAAAFVDVALHELTGRVEALPDVSRALASVCAGADDPALTAPVRVSRLLDGLRAVLARRQAQTSRAGFVRGVGRGGVSGFAPHDALVDEAVLRLRRSTGALGVAVLARQLGCTPRHLSRRFAERVGLSPKALARTLRFQHVFRAVGALPQVGRDGAGAWLAPGRSARASAPPPDGPATWAAVAVACGYADHSHLIREFRQFSGQRPPEFLADGNALARLLLRRGASPGTPAGPPARAVSDPSKTPRSTAC